MLPIFLNLGFVRIYSFGVFLVLAFFWGSYLLWKNIRLTAYKEEDIFDGLFISVFTGLFIGRLVHVILNFSSFGFSILKFILINGYPGFSLYGVLLGSFTAFLIFCSVKKIQFMDLIDYCIAPLFLALGIGKLGSFLAGSEPGTRTQFILSVRYVGLEGQRHITNLYEGVLFFIGACIAYKLMFEIRKSIYSKGFSFLFFIWFIGLIGFVFDKLKVYHIYFLGFSVDRGVSFLLLLTLSFYFVYYFRSLLKKQISSISNSFFHYGNKTVKNLYHSTKRTAGKGKDKNP